MFVKSKAIFSAKGYYAKRSQSPFAAFPPNSILTLTNGDLAFAKTRTVTGVFCQHMGAKPLRWEVPVCLPKLYTEF